MLWILIHASHHSKLYVCCNWGRSQTNILKWFHKLLSHVSPYTVLNSGLWLNRCNTTWITVSVVIHTFHTTKKLEGIGDANKTWNLSVLYSQISQCSAQTEVMKKFYQHLTLILYWKTQPSIFHTGTKPEHHAICPVQQANSEFKKTNSYIPHHSHSLCINFSIMCPYFLNPLLYKIHLSYAGK